MSARTTEGTPKDVRPPDAIDRSILKVLRDDARISLRELAGKVKISRANAYSRVGRLREEGIIRGFTVQLDPKRAGLGIAALITVTVEQRRWRDVLEEVARMPEVEFCAAISGEFDTVIMARAPTIEMIRDVVLERLHEIEGVVSTKTYFVLEETTPKSVMP